MKNYIGIKLVQAEQAEKDGKAGYKVVYADGYESWSPADVFEKAYMELGGNPELPSKVSISQENVDDFISDVYVSTIGEKTTLVRAVLVNGFEIVEASSCVDAANYSIEIGEQVCMERIKNKIWELLGFLLQTAVGGVK